MRVEGFWAPGLSKGCRFRAGAFGVKFLDPDREGLILPQGSVSSVRGWKKRPKSQPRKRYGARAVFVFTVEKTLKVLEV